MPLEEAKEELMKIFGVGPKVADCALLYGFYRLECCPIDIWMKRVFFHLYPNGLPLLRQRLHRHCSAISVPLRTYLPDVFPKLRKS